VRTTTLLLIATTALAMACGGGAGTNDPGGPAGDVPADGTAQDIRPDDAVAPDADRPDAADPGGPDAADATDCPCDQDPGPGDVPAVDPGPPPFDPPACGSLEYAWRGLVPGPGEDGFDAALEAKARRIERAWQAFNANAMGLNTDVTVALANADDRAAIETWLRDHDDWDFAGFAGKAPRDVITSQHKVAGLYAGVGAAADAFRYAVLRDQGYPCDEVAQARTHLLRAIEGLHTAVAITGAPGVIVRGLARKDLPGDGQTPTTPLFDGDGKPLPEVKNNGTWREDFSEGGQYPDLIWEDSVSRDMYVGWVAAYASVWEVIRDDPAFDQALKDRLRADALAVARQLKVVRDSGYDLEIVDADGRTTLHGWLNEANVDGQFYLEGFENGFHATMALGIVAAWVFVTDDPDLKAWLRDDLIAKRQFPRIIAEQAGVLLDMGYNSNYSNYNMAFTGIWLAFRYLDDPAALATLRTAVRDQMYARPGADRQPEEIGYSFYDFIYAAGRAGMNPWWPMATEPETDAVARGVTTLQEFADAPYWDFGKIHCPEAVCDCEDTTVDSSQCTALDGTELTVLGCVGRNCDLITLEPIPMRTLGPSNYHWRSNPYRPNREGSGAALLPAVDFRIAYWMGRHFRRPNP
jgi:hypothetical protein